MMNPAAAGNVVRSPTHASGTSSSSSESCDSESSSSHGSSSRSSAGSSTSRRDGSTANDRSSSSNNVVIPPKMETPAAVRSHSTELDWLSLLDRGGGGNGGGYEGDDDDDDNGSACSSLTSDGGGTNWSSIFLQPTASSGTDGDVNDGLVAQGSVLSNLVSSRDDTSLHEDTGKSIQSITFREKVVQFYSTGGRDPSKLREGDRTLSNNGKVHHQATGNVRDDLHRSTDGRVAAATAGTGEYPRPPPSGTARCFLVLSSHPRERVVIELFADQVPTAVQQFLALCQKPFERGNPRFIVHRIVPNAYVQLGESTEVGRESRFPHDDKPATARDEPLFQHSEAGLLSLVDCSSATGPSFFIITARPMPHFDGTHTIVGRVVEGLDSVVRCLTHNTALDDRQRPMFEQISIVDCGTIVDGVDVRPEEPSPVTQIEEFDTHERAVAIPSFVPPSSSIETADSTTKTAALSSTFSLGSIQAAASLAVSCGAFLPHPSIAAAEAASTYDEGEELRLSTNHLRRRSILSHSMSSESEEDSESVQAGSPATPNPAESADHDAILAAVRNTELEVVDYHGSRPKALSSVPSIPISFSSYSATSSAANDVPAPASSLLSTPITSNAAMRNERRDDIDDIGADSRTDNRDSTEPPRDTADGRGTSRSTGVKIVKGEMLPPVAEGTVMRLVSQFDRMRHGSAHPPHAYPSKHFAGTKRAALGKSARGSSKLEPSGLLLDEGSIYGSDGGPPPRDAVELGPERAERASDGTADLTASFSMQDFLTKIEDALARSDHRPPAASIGSDDDTRNESLRVLDKEQGSGFTAVLSLSTVDEGASAVVTSPEPRKTPTAHEGDVRENPPNLYSMSFSTVASSHHLASPHHEFELQPLATGSSSCASSADEASPKHIGRLETALMAPPDVTSLAESLVRSFGWIGGCTSKDNDDDDTCGTDNDDNAKPPLIHVTAKATTFSSPAASAITSRLRPALKASKYAAPPAMKSPSPPASSPRDQERFGGRRRRLGGSNKGPRRDRTKKTSKGSRRSLLSPLRGGPSLSTMMSSDFERESVPAPPPRSLVAEASLSLPQGNKGFLPYAT
jgi:peptidyl-prolyl cis-trans isomerase B (cyclophilin B)